MLLKMDDAGSRQVITLKLFALTVAMLFVSLVLVVNVVAAAVMVKIFCSHDLRVAEYAAEVVG